MLYMLLSMNLFINLILIINFFYLNIFSNPLNQLLMLIYYTIFMAINIMVFKSSISMSLFILLIIYISGMLILFSYFISMMNNISKKNNNLSNKLLFINMMLLILLLIQLENLKTTLKNLNYDFHYQKNFSMIKKLYLTPNILILILFIIMLILMLMITTKMCYINNKCLRMKK
nr:TPA_asm: ND6 [Bombus nevadensis]